MDDNNDSIYNTRKTYDQIASGYSAKIDKLISDSWVGKFERGLLDRFLLQMRVASPRVLDIGCGNGKDTSYLMQKGAICVGMDISSGMLKEARKRLPDGKFLQMDMRNLGFFSETFNGVWANGCIYHVPKIEIAQVLKELRHVLKPTGVFSFNAKVGAGERFEEHPRSYHGGPRFYAYYTINEMTGYLKQAGFEIVESEDYPQEIFGEKIFHVFAWKPKVG